MAPGRQTGGRSPTRVTRRHAPERKRSARTPIGDAVNLAARVQAIAQGGEVLVTLKTLERISGSVTADPLPPVQIRGKTATVPIFRITSLK